MKRSDFSKAGILICATVVLAILLRADPKTPRQICLEKYDKVLDACQKLAGKDLQKAKDICKRTYLNNDIAEMACIHDAGEDYEKAMKGCKKTHDKNIATCPKE